MSKTETKRERIVCIDRFRGTAIFAMIFFQAAERFSSLGVLSRIANHLLDEGIVIMPGMVLADIVAPIFFLVIALNYIPSFRQRAGRDGKKAAYLHFVIRYLAILGFGCCIKTIENVFDGQTDAFDTICLVCTVIALVSGIATLLLGISEKTARARAVVRKILIASLAAAGAICIVSSSVNAYQIFYLDTHKNYWGVLQSIGAAGLIMLLFVESGAAVRGAAAGFLFVIYAFFHEIPGNMELIDVDVQGGLSGILGWTSMLLAFSVMADLYYRDRAARRGGRTGAAAHSYLIGLAVLVVLGITGGLLFVVNKGSVSPGYILVNLPISAFLFWLFSLTDGWEPRLRPLTWWGISPVIMYLLQYLLVDVVLSLADGLTGLSFVPALCYVIGVTLVITAIAYLLHRKQKAIRM